MNHLKSESFATSETAVPEEDASFAELLSSFERHHGESAGETLQGVIVSVSPEAILVDIGRKMEGALPLSVWREQHEEEPKPGDSIVVRAAAMRKAISVYRSCGSSDRRIGAACSARLWNAR